MSDRVKAVAERLGGEAYVVGYTPGMPHPTPKWEIALSVEQAEKVADALDALRYIADPTTGLSGADCRALAKARVEEIGASDVV